MEVDVARLVPAVTRTVKRYTKDGKPHVSVVLSRVYDTSVDDLWDALTNAERLPRWFAPVTGELKLGGRYQVQGNAGGTVTACTPPKHFAATWEFGGGVSWIEVTVTPEGGKARMTLDHIAVDDGNPHWDKFGPGAVGIGWDLGLVGLGVYFELAAQGKKSDPLEGMAWMSSDNGKAFIRASGEGWRAADVAGGNDAPTARRRSDMTIAFYCGEQPPGTQHPGGV
jgi:uncharacterized protein YndB with AHSA1/START domain